LTLGLQLAEFFDSDYQFLHRLIRSFSHRILCRACFQFANVGCKSVSPFLATLFQISSYRFVGVLRLVTVSCSGRIGKNCQATKKRDYYEKVSKRTHGLAVEVFWPAMGDVAQIDAGGGESLAPTTKVADCGVVHYAVATAVHLGP